MKKITFLYLIFTLILSANLFAQQNSTDASFSSQKVESNMQAGKTYSVTVTFKNSGKQTWIKGENWIMYSDPRMNALNNNLWDIDSIKVGKNVRPGKTYQFKFNVTAPSQPGTYFFSWQMCNSSGAFGSGSELVEIHVK